MPTKPPLGIMDDPSHPLSKGCVYHLLFNEGAGSLAYDVSGHGNHGALKNMSPNAQDSGWGGSKFGGGLAFDGTDDYVDCGDITETEFGIGDFTFTVWVNNSQTLALHSDIYTLFSKGSGAAPNFYMHLRGGPYNGIDYRSYFGEVWEIIKPSSSQNNLLSDGNWHIICLTRISNNTELYIDGNSVGTDTDNNSYSTPLNFYIGKLGATYLNGIIDELRIYNRALNVQEIKQLYHDPFCNLMQVPAWQLYSPVAAGYNVSMQLTQALQIAQVGTAAANSILNLSEVLSFVTAGQSASNASITLNTGHTIVLNASAVANSTLALAIYLTLVQATGTDVDVDITLSHALAFTDIAQASVSASFTLTNIASLSQTGLATAEAALSLGYNNAITNISTSAISAQLALAISAGINTAVTIAISEDISLSQNFTIQSLALTEAEGELSLDQVLALTIVGEAIATANLPLSIIQSVTITATTVDILLGDISDPTILSITVDRTFKSQTKKRSFQHTM